MLPGSRGHLERQEGATCARLTFLLLDFSWGRLAFWFASPPLGWLDGFLFVSETPFEFTRGTGAHHVTDVLVTLLIPWLFISRHNQVQMSDTLINLFSVNSTTSPPPPQCFLRGSTVLSQFLSIIGGLFFYDFELLMEENKFISLSSGKLWRVLSTSFWHFIDQTLTDNESVWKIICRWINNECDCYLRPVNACRMSSSCNLSLIKAGRFSTQPGNFFSPSHLHAIPSIWDTIDDESHFHFKDNRGEQMQTMIQTWYQNKRKDSALLIP